MATYGHAGGYAFNEDQRSDPNCGIHHPKVSAQCTASACQAPALVPNGLCLEHARREAFEAVHDYRRGTFGVAEALLAKVLSLGLRPEHFKPQQEEPGI